MRIAVTVTVAAILTAAGPMPMNGADDLRHDHYDVVKPSRPGASPIHIRINPEARTSVTRGGDLPPPVPCGRGLDIRVRILNESFLTAPLLATLVSSIPAKVTVGFSVEPLTGAREEYRVLRVTITEPGPVDVTIAIHPQNDIPDLGGRDRIHFLLRCRG